MVKFSDYFNSTTITGRANVAKATYATIAAIYVYARFKRSKKNAGEHPKCSSEEEEKYLSKNDQGTHSNATEYNGKGGQHFTCLCCDDCSKNESGAANGDKANGHTNSVESLDHTNFYGGTHGNEGNSTYSDSPHPDKGSCN